MERRVDGKDDRDGEEKITMSLGNLKLFLSKHILCQHFIPYNGYFTAVNPSKTNLTNIEDFPP